jgi:adenine-specific DNA methylase
MLEDIPRHGPELAEELRRVGAQIKQQAEKELAELYPKDPDGSVPIAYLWARTVRCEAPNCGAEIPLVRSFWLCKKASRKRALRYKIVKGGPPRVEFEVFEPKTEKDVPAGTVTRAKATCLCCGTGKVLAPERVRAQLAVQRGGADVVFDEQGRRIGGARLLAVVTLKPGEQGRHYRLPTERDYEAARRAQERLRAILGEWEQLKKAGPLPAGRQVCPVPDEPTPAGGGSGAVRAFSVQRYGMFQWGDLFTARQKVALVTLARLARERPAADDEAVRAAMAFAISKQSDFNSTLSRWANHMEKSVATFGRQALPML